VIESSQFCYDIWVILVLVDRDDAIWSGQNTFLTPSPTHSTDTNHNVVCTHSQCNDTSKWETISVRWNNDTARCNDIHVTILTPARTPQGNCPGSEKNFSQEISVRFIISCIPSGLWADIKEFSEWRSCWSAVANQHSLVKGCSPYKKHQLVPISMSVLNYKCWKLTVLVCRMQALYISWAEITSRITLHDLWRTAKFTSSLRKRELIRTNMIIVSFPLFLWHYLLNFGT
jgi:hypothetical protein